MARDDVEVRAGATTFAPMNGAEGTKAEALSSFRDEQEEQRDEVLTLPGYRNAH